MRGVTASAAQSLRSVNAGSVAPPCGTGRDRCACKPGMVVMGCFNEGRATASPGDSYGAAVGSETASPISLRPKNEGRVTYKRSRGAADFDRYA